MDPVDNSAPVRRAAFSTRVYNNLTLVAT